MGGRARDFLRSIKGTLLFFVLICWLLPALLLGAYMGGRFFTSLREKTESALIAGARHAQGLLLQNLAHVISLAKDVTYDGEVSEAVTSYAAGRLRNEDYRKIVRNYIDRKYSRERLCDYAIFFRLEEPSQILYTSQGYFFAMDFVRDAQRDVIGLCETLDTRCRFYAEGDRVYLVRNLYNTRMERYGILVLGLNAQALTRPVTDAAADNRAAFALSIDDYHLGTFLPQTRAGELEEYGDALCYTQTVSDYDYALRFQVQADRRAVYREMDNFRALLTFLLWLLVPVCAGIMVYVQKRIVRPIGLLSDASRRIEAGELGVVVPMRGKDELGRLGSAFSEMSLRLKTLVDKSSKEEIALRDARIQAMQSRINPHFLNNALEAINWQARMDGDAAVGEMVESLSVLLNASMDRSGGHTAPMEEELKVADAYFRFIALKFGEKLTVSKQVEPEVLPLPVPRMMLQTLLENAVEHGVGPIGGGRIELKAYRDGGLLVIEVVNDGKRLSTEDLARIRKLMDATQPDDGHIGIRNVSARLSLLYGGAAHIDIAPNASGDTVVTVRLPFDDGLLASKDKK